MDVSNRLLITDCYYYDYGRIGKNRIQLTNILITFQHLLNNWNSLKRFLQSLRSRCFRTLPHYYLHSVKRITFSNCTHKMGNELPEVCTIKSIDTSIKFHSLELNLYLKQFRAISNTQINKHFQWVFSLVQNT